MTSHPNEDVQRVAETLGDHMDKILQLFKPGMKITVLIRNTGKPDGSQDLVLTNDELSAAITALEIRTNPAIPSLQGSV